MSVVDYIRFPSSGSGGGGGGVTSLNGLTGVLNIVAGSGITVTPAGSNITIASTGGGGIAIGDTITGGTDHSVLFVDGTDLAQDVNLTYDRTTGLSLDMINLEGAILGTSNTSRVYVDFIGDRQTQTNIFQLVGSVAQLRTGLINAGSSGLGILGANVYPFSGTFSDSLGLGYTAGAALPTLALGEIGVPAGTPLLLSTNSGVTIGKAATTAQHTLNTALGTPAAVAVVFTNAPTGSGTPAYISITVNGVAGYIPFIPA